MEFGGIDAIDLFRDLSREFGITQDELTALLGQPSCATIGDLGNLIGQHLAANHAALAPAVIEAKLIDILADRLSRDRRTIGPQSRFIEDLDL